jgi:hypothetical protein
MTTSPAPVVHREQLIDELAKMLQLDPLKRLGLAMTVQAIPEPLFHQLREILEDIAALAQPGDNAAIERAFQSRESRRSILQAVLDYARTH